MAKNDDIVNSMAGLLKIQALDVEAALFAHGDWKRRLRDAVSLGFSERDSDDVGRDDLCELGCWLHSLRSEHGGDPLCEDLIELHARFHQAAAAVVRLIEAGRTEEARAAMDSESEFALTSEELVGLLESWREAA